MNNVPQLEATVALRQCSNDLARAYAFYFESQRKVGLTGQHKVGGEGKVGGGHQFLRRAEVPPMGTG